MLRSSLRGAFPAIGIDAQLEVHGTALRLQPPARRRTSVRHLPPSSPGPRSAWVPLSACPPQDGVTFAMNPNGADGAGL